LGDEKAVLVDRHPHFMSLFAVERQPLEGKDQQILEIGRLLHLAAHPYRGTSRVFGCFLTLKTEHVKPPFFEKWLGFGNLVGLLKRKWKRKSLT